MIIIFQKIEKKINFIKKIAKTRDIKKIDNHSIISKNYATVFQQNLKEVPRTLVPENDKEFHKKLN